MIRSSSGPFMRGLLTCCLDRPWRDMAAVHSRTREVSEHILGPDPSEPVVNLVNRSRPLAVG